METSHYRMWVDLSPAMRRWEWRLQCSWLGPGRARWFRKAEDKLRAFAEQKGATLIGDPIAYADERNGVVVVRAEALASAPYDPDAAAERGPKGGEG